MPLMYQAGSLQMAWCLDCHRQPERFIRPREQVFNLHYDADHDPDYPGENPGDAWDQSSLTNITWRTQQFLRVTAATCHR